MPKHIQKEVLNDLKMRMSEFGWTNALKEYKEELDFGDKNV